MELPSTSIALRGTYLYAHVLHLHPTNRVFSPASSRMSSQTAHADLLMMPDYAALRAQQSIAWWRRKTLFPARCPWCRLIATRVMTASENDLRSRHRITAAAIGRLNSRPHTPAGLLSQLLTVEPVSSVGGNKKTYIGPKTGIARPPSSCGVAKVRPRNIFV